MKTKLMIDSVSFMQEEYLRENNIANFEVYVSFNGDLKKDLTEIDIDDYTKNFKDFDELPKTTMATPQDALDIFNKAIDEGYEEIFYLALTPAISGQANVARIASRKVKDKIKIHIYQTELVGGSQAVLLLYSQAMLAEGKKVPEIIEFLESIKGKIETIGISTSFDVLFKSGRANKDVKTTLATKIFNLKPIYKTIIKRGVVGFGAGLGIRGSIKKLIKEIESKTDPSLEYNLIMSHADGVELAQKIEENIRKIRNIKEVDYWKIPPAVVITVGYGAAIATIYPVYNQLKENL